MRLGFESASVRRGRLRHSKRSKGLGFYGYRLEALGLWRGTI